MSTISNNESLSVQETESLCDYKTLKQLQIILIEHDALIAHNNGEFIRAFELRQKANELFEIIYPEKLDTLEILYRDLIRDMAAFMVK